MNRIEYLNQLSLKLKRLPKEDYEKAMAYFQEYFEDAGLEHEQNAIEDLGSPETAADQIIMELAIKNTKRPSRGMKDGISKVWIAILAVFAAPIALPLALGVVLIGLAFLLMIFAVAFSFFVAIIAIGIAAVLGTFGSIILLFTSPLDGVATLGVSLFTIGLGFFATYGSIVFFKWSLRVTATLFSRLVKGGHRHEK